MNQNMELDAVENELIQSTVDYSNVFRHLIFSLGSIDGFAPATRSDGVVWDKPWSSVAAATATAGMQHRFPG